MAVVAASVFLSAPASAQDQDKLQELSLTLHRHDNIIQRVLSLADHLWVSFIADGVHVPFDALGNYIILSVWTGPSLFPTP